MAELCGNASWKPCASSFTDNRIIGSSPQALFINLNNTIFVANQHNGRILLWPNASINKTTTILANLSYPMSLFVTSEEQIFVGTVGYSAGGVQGWTSNGTRFSSMMSGCQPCSGLCVDLMDNLYCSQGGWGWWGGSQVVRRSLQSPTDEWTVVAGTGCSGSDPNRLNNPAGIFVTSDLGLYVADCGNDRVQLFQSGQRNATTVAGNGSIGTTALRCPTGITLDADGYLFIVDSNNHRIIGQGPGGFRCVVGCSGNSGLGPNQLLYPQTMSFDRDGNMFVLDSGNNRLQKFYLSNNTCG